MATRDEIYTAIRNADKAGDSAAVRKLGDYLKTLPADAPQPVNASSTHDMALQRAAQYEAKAKAERENQPGIVGNTLGVIGGFGKGLADTVGHLGSAAIATPVAGIAGAISAPFVGKDRAADITRNVGEAMTYQPRSEVGQQAAEMQNIPGQWLGEKADQAGGAVTDVTGSPALGTLVTTGLQAAPALIAPEARGAFASAGRTVANGARAVAGGAKIAAAAVDPAVIAAAAAKAKAYVTGTAGLDWDSLSDSLKAKLTSVAQTAGQLEQLDPAALAREAKLQSLPVPVPATRGQLTRDPVQLRNEGNVSTTSAGAPISDVHLAANKALLDNLDVLKGKVTGVGKTASTSPEQSGAVVQGALRQGEALSKADYKAAYKTPDTMAPTAQVSAQPLYDLLEGRPDIQRLGFLQSWLNKAKITKTTTTDGVTVAEQRPVSVSELRDLKEQAGEIMKTGGTDGLYAGKVYDAVQNAIKEHPEIKAAYDVADAKFSAHKIKYEDQAAVSDLVSNASRTDRTTALSNTVKAVTTGAPEEIRQIKRTLLTGGDETTRTAGRQAWRDVRAQVIQGIKDDATNGVAPNADGSANLTAIGLKRAIDRYGPQKLEEIFGPGTTRQINAIMDAAKDVKTLPPSKEVGSSTLANVLAFLEKGVTKVPVLGKAAAVVGGTAVDIARGIAQLKNMGAGAREARAATVTPLNEAVAKAAGKSARADYGRQAKGAVPLVPLSALSQPQR